MPRILEYTFPASNAYDVCALQIPLAGGVYVLNGNLANITNTEISFIDRGYSRNVSITSANDTSALTYTVTGYQNGVRIVEEITGPDNATVYGQEIFDTIISVTSNDAFDNPVSVGSGTKGFFRVINIDLNNFQFGSSFLNLITKTAPAISSTIYATPIDLTATGLTYKQIIAGHINNLFPIKTASAAANYGALLSPYRSVIILLDGDGTNANSVMYMNFTQTTQFQT